MSNKKKEGENRKLAIAETVRESCIQAAREGFQDASISGLCAEGAMEAAISAIQQLDLKIILEKNPGETNLQP